MMVVEISLCIYNKFSKGISSFLKEKYPEWLLSGQIINAIRKEIFSIQRFVFFFAETYPKKILWENILLHQFPAQKYVFIFFFT
jgi:hypothetical protein